MPGVRLIAGRSDRVESKVARWSRSCLWVGAFAAYVALRAAGARVRYLSSEREHEVDVRLDNAPRRVDIEQQRRLRTCRGPRVRVPAKLVVDPRDGALADGSLSRQRAPRRTPWRALSSGDAIRGASRPNHRVSGSTSSMCSTDPTRHPAASQ